jgi:hypothetical protein
MVQSMKIGDVASMPPLFPFQESFCPVEDLLKRELYPPLPLWERGDRAGCTIVWGKRIVEKLSELPMKEVLVRKFGPGELTLTEALIVWIGLEQRQGGWRWTELADLYPFVHKHRISLPEPLLSTLVGSEENWHRVEQFMQLSEPLRQLVSEEKLDLKTALRVKSIDPQAIEQLKPVLESLSYSERRILLRLFYEVVQRDRLDSPQSMDLASRLKDTPKPLEELYRIRYPSLHHLQETYHATVDTFLKGTGIKVTPPPYFEGTQFRVEFVFDKGSQLQRKALTLQKLSEKIDPVIETLVYGTE